MAGGCSADGRRVGHEAHADGLQPIASQERRNTVSPVSCFVKDLGDAWKRLWRANTQQAAGNREQAQANAAAGALSPRRIVRTVVVYGPISAALRQAIAVAVHQEPLTASVRAGGLLLEENTVVA